MIEQIQLLKYLIGLIFLGYSSFLDLNTRTIPDRLWKFMLLLMIPFILIELYYSNFNLMSFMYYLFQVFFIFFFSYTLYYLGLYGGADAKALIILGLIFPTYPESYPFPVFGTGFNNFAFSTFSNSLLVMPLLVLLNFIRNLYREGFRGLKRDFFYYLFGQKVDAKSIPKFMFLFEYFDCGRLVRGKKSVEPDKVMLETLKRKAEQGQIDRIWATHAIPFLIFITAGYIISFIAGDLLYLVISVLFGLAGFQY